MFSNPELLVHSHHRVDTNYSMFTLGNFKMDRLINLEYFLVDVL